MAQIDFFLKVAVYEYSGGRLSAKTGSERLDGMLGTIFHILSAFCQKFSMPSAQIWIIVGPYDDI